MGFGITSVMVFPKSTTSSTISIAVVKDEPMEKNNEIADQLYRAWLEKQKPIEGALGTVLKSIVIDPAPYIYKGRCSCVKYARAVSGIDVGPIGQAKNHPTNRSLPVVGGLFITYEGPSGHMGVVSGIEGNSFIGEDFNYESCTKTIRKIPIDSPLIKGYYY